MASGLRQARPNRAPPRPAQTATGAYHGPALRPGGVRDGILYNWPSKSGTSIVKPLFYKTIPFLARNLLFLVWCTACSVHTST